MRLRLACAVFLVLVLPCLAPLSAGEVSGSETDTFESLTVVVVQGQRTISGDDAVALRTGMDALGNNNSVVEGGEVTAFETSYEEFIRENANEYTLNGVAGAFTSIVVTVKNAEGPVNSTKAVTYEYQGRISFSDLGADLGSYTYRIMNEGGDPADDMDIVVTVPDGYEITGTQGIIAPQYSSSSRTVTGGTLADTNIVLSFSTVDEWGWLMGPILISALISIIVVALITLAKYTSVFEKGEGETFGERQSDDDSEGPAENANP